MTRKTKDPFKAVFLNIALPGLGLAYLGMWGYALLFFLWAPLRLMLGISVIGAISISLSGTDIYLLNYVLIFAWWLAVMYDICKTPYDLAREHNRITASQIPGIREASPSGVVS